MLVEVKTPGLKLWTFGKQSLTADVNDSTVWLRPTIEMWHGVTPELWSRGTMTANEVRATVANGKVPSGATFQAELVQGDKSLLSGQITLP